jgi:peroxiredoxin
MKQHAVILTPVGALVVIGGLFLVERYHGGPLKIGDSAPNFNLPLFHPAASFAALVPANGDRLPSRIRLSDYHDRVVLVNFWATWCPPCIEETPSLERFAEQVRQDGAVVIGVSVDEDADTLAKFVARFNMSFPVARDPDKTMAARYGTFQFPETYILDRDGRVAEKIIGEQDWQDPRILAYVRALAHSNERAAR